MAMHRVALITIGLVLAGIVTGSLCGVAATAPVAIAEWIRPNPEPTLANPGLVVAGGAVIGAMVGAIFAPLVAWGWLRHVPLWRVVVVPTLGTLVGASAGWLAVVAISPLDPVALLLGSSLLGTAAGSLLLRRGKGVLPAPPSANPVRVVADD